MTLFALASATSAWKSSAHVASSIGSESSWMARASQPAIGGLRDPRGGVIFGGAVFGPVDEAFAGLFAAVEAAADTPAAAATLARERAGEIGAVAAA